jgi:hypothetical protein
VSEHVFDETTKNGALPSALDERRAKGLCAMCGEPLTEKEKELEGVGGSYVRCDECVRQIAAGSFDGGVAESRNAPVAPGEVQGSRPASSVEYAALVCVECGETMGVETSTRNGQPCHIRCPRDYPGPVGDALRRLRDERVAAPESCL